MADVHSTDHADSDSLWMSILSIILFLWMVIATPSISESDEEWRAIPKVLRKWPVVGYRTPAQARMEAEALVSSRPTGSLCQELEDTPALAILDAQPNLPLKLDQFWRLDHFAFDTASPAVSLGQCSKFGHLSDQPPLKPNSPLDKTFLQAAGRER